MIMNHIEQSTLDLRMSVAERANTLQKNDIMGMYARINIMRANGLLDIPDEKLIYIYKLTCNHTGHFYIGQTGSVKDRIYRHMQTIVKIIEGEPVVSQKIHTVVASAIKELHEKNKKIKIERFTREALSVYVIALVADKETALLIETNYIKKSIKDPLCLNVSK